MYGWIDCCALRVKVNYYTLYIICTRRDRGARSGRHRRSEYNKLISAPRTRCTERYAERLRMCTYTALVCGGRRGL